ncbi:MAG TPA: ribosomal protein S18-alanine N-acetyltransferase [Candidatus Krumholzibacteria bacterium]|nr:ribosomal protein S18-alanine N-acetyltransferase [Candidatus Krumholzibacteria bacterium]
MEVSLQAMGAEHLEQVLAIERTFAAPWTREMFLQELRLQWDVSESLVAVRDGEVVGYVLCWYVADEVHVVNLAVHGRWRRRGIGRRMMEEVCARASRRGASTATLEVRFRNEAAIRLYEGLGFRQVAIRRAYYADNGEDALVMLKELEPLPGG